ncbi:MAG: hypothetical protein QME58_05065 [Bacteroidota bacterium]|nr:hypothetical protein [Bacteroidota bacterium]
MKKIICVFMFFFGVQAVITQPLSNSDNGHKNIVDFFNQSIELESRNASVFSAYSASQKKSVPLAVALSLVLPGMGELYTGDYSRGKYLTSAEGFLWLTFTSVQLYGTWLKNDARLFAVTNAGVNLDGKDDKFFVNIGNYSDIYWYNERKLQDREEDQLYDPNSNYYWQWNNEASRQKYRYIRIKSDEVFNSRQFIVGAILANHIVSAINAGMLASKYNKQSGVTNNFQINSKLRVNANHPEFVFTISKLF